MGQGFRTLLESKTLQVILMVTEAISNIVRGMSDILNEDIFRMGGSDQAIASRFQIKGSQKGGIQCCTKIVPRFLRVASDWSKVV